MQKERLKYIDIAKGIGILLVIMGHCIPDASTPAGVSEPHFAFLFNVIYSFHMPLFFFISGYLCKPVENSKEIKLFIIKKRFKRLMIPYFFVGICYFPLKLLFVSWANNPYNATDFINIFVGLNPDGELWFLYTLFWVITIATIFGNKINGYGLFLSAILAIIDIRTHVFPITFLWFAFFFFLGMYIKRYLKDFIFNLANFQVVILWILFAGGNFMLMNHSFAEWRLITSVVGTILTLHFAFKFSKFDFPIIKYLSVIGVFSMDLYILSDILKIPFRIIFWNCLHLYATTFFICMLVGTIGSFLVSKYYIRKNKFLSTMILGLEN